MITIKVITVKSIQLTTKFVSNFVFKFSYTSTQFLKLYLEVTIQKIPFNNLKKLIQLIHQT